MSQTTGINDGLVQLFGPWYVSPADNGSAMRTGWESSSIEVAFVGTQLQVTYSKKANGHPTNGTDSYLFCSVDGGNVTIGTFSGGFANTTTVTAVTGLSNSAHKARLWFFEASAYGIQDGSSYSDVLSLTTDGSFSWFSPESPYGHIIGDSICCVSDAWPFHLSTVVPYAAAIGGALAAATNPWGVGGDTGIHSLASFYPLKVNGGGNLYRSESVIVISLGTNDLAYGVSASAFASSISTLITSARNGNPDIPVLLVCPIYTNSGAYLSQNRAYLAALQNLASSTITVLDAYTDLHATMTYRDGNNPGTPGDVTGTHPNAAGMLAFASYIDSKISELDLPNPNLPCYYDLADEFLAISQQVDGTISTAVGEQGRVAEVEPVGGTATSSSIETGVSGQPITFETAYYDLAVAIVAVSIGPNTIIFGERFFQSIQFSILVEGSINVGPTITITADGGQVDNPRIYFRSENDPDVVEFLALMFTPSLPKLEDGDRLEIVCEKQNKSVTRYVAATGQYMNYIGAVSLDSAWPILHPGINLLSYDAKSGGAYIRLGYEYAVKYSGV